MSFYTIDRNKCKADGICVEECPLGILEMKDGADAPTPIDGADEMCINCGHCVAVCPGGAFSLDKMKPEDCLAMEKDFVLGAEKVEGVLRSRRSIRNYKEKEIDAETLEKLISVARYAPTGTNGQLVKWLVINSRRKVLEMTEMALDMVRYMINEKHPMATAYKLDRIVTAWESGKDRISRGAPCLVVAYAPEQYPLSKVDATIALTYLDLAASSFGLGACWAGYFMVAIPQWEALRNAISLPEGYACQGVMMVGYPKYKYQLLPQRNPADIKWL